MTAYETMTHPSSNYTYSEDDFDGHHAAPVLIVGNEADPNLIASQDKLAASFEQLAWAELSEYVRPRAITFTAQSIATRMQQREGLNGMSYMMRRHKSPLVDFDPEVAPETVLAATKNLENGSGSVTQNELARKALGMSSVEYANLTIVGEARKQLEPGMWRAVSHLVGKDASPKPDDMYGVQILGFDRNIKIDGNISAVRIGMKRYVGETVYGAQVKARTTAIVKPISLYRHMGLGNEEYRSLLAHFQEVATSEKEVTALPEFMQAVHWLVSTPLPPGIVLARNETVYGVESSAQ